MAGHDRQGARRQGRHGCPRRRQGPHGCATAGVPTSSSARPRTRPAPPPAACCRSSTTRPGARIRQRSLDSTSAGVARQAALRDEADDEGYVERHLWTGVGRARSGAGAAIVGDPDQVLAKIEELADAGIEAFILSGYPHAAECDLFARHVLPRLDHGRLEFSPDPVNPD